MLHVKPLLWEVFWEVGAEYAGPCVICGVHTVMIWVEVGWQYSLVGKRSVYCHIGPYCPEELDTYMGPSSFKTIIDGGYKGHR